MYLYPPPPARPRVLLLVPLSSLRLLFPWHWPLIERILTVSFPSPCLAPSHSPSQRSLIYRINTGPNMRIWAAPFLYQLFFQSILPHLCLLRCLSTPYLFSCFKSNTSKSTRFSYMSPSRIRASNSLVKSENVTPRRGWLPESADCFV